MDRVEGGASKANERVPPPGCPLEVAQSAPGGGGASDQEILLEGGASREQGSPSPAGGAPCSRGESETSLPRHRRERMRRGQPLRARLVRESPGLLPLHVRPGLRARSRRPQLRG